MYFEVWTEGYMAQGGGSGAHYWGQSRGKNFKEAVDNLMNKPEHQEEAKKFYDPVKLTYWGCKFFAYESDARKSFG